MKKTLPVIMGLNLLIGIAAFSQENAQSIPASKVGQKGIARQVSNGVYEISVPIEFEVSKCESFSSYTKEDYVDSAIPMAVSSERRAFDVRAYTKETPVVMTASIVPVPSKNCSKKKMIREILTLNVKGSKTMGEVVTMITIPIKTSKRTKLAKFLVHVTPGSLEAKISEI